MGLTPDEAVRRVKCALAEMGYPGVHVYHKGTDALGLVNIGVIENIPNAPAWQAFALSGLPTPCWSCWHLVSRDTWRSTLCWQGNCTAGPDDPRTPPRELLVGAR